MGVLGGKELFEMEILKYRFQCSENLDLGAGQLPLLFIAFNCLLEDYLLGGLPHRTMWVFNQRGWFKYLENVLNVHSEIVTLPSV